MGKIVSALAMTVVLASAGVVPMQTLKVQAQTSLPAVSCSAVAPATPMPGHYTGLWHSIADYHFLAFGHDIDLQVTINGTLDMTVASDGHMTGSVQGTVDAPETHDGQKDVSSGHGTITGQVQGVFSPAGSLAVLSQPVIFMHWGTFVGGGYTADRYITMPDYQFSVGSVDCVNSSGTIAEQGFPTQNIVNDFNGGIVQVPGVGAASGTWQITSDSAVRFGQLSQQVNDLLAHANTLLQDPTVPVTPAMVDQQVAQPLRALEATIRQDPSVARCLLDRIGAWEIAVINPLMQRAQQLAGADLATERHAGDLVRSAQLLNLDCGIDQHVALDAVMTAGTALLDNTITAGSWSSAALAIRELYLLGGSDGQARIQAQVYADLHTQMTSATGSRLLELARIAYLFGDDTDASDAYHRLPATSAAVQSFQQFSRPKPKKKKHHPKAKPVATPKPTPTSTPVPKSLTQVLNTGLHPVVTSGSTGTPPTFTWQPEAGAAQYVVTLTSDASSELLWSWSGTATAVTYGDTTLAGIAGSEHDAWSSMLPASYTWSVLAFNQQGKIIGAAFRVTS